MRGLKLKATRATAGSVMSREELRRSRAGMIEATGWIDRVDEEFEIHGWAFSPDEAPALVHLSYDGKPYCTTIADKYRPDVEAAGIGSGRVGFSVPAPCEPERFDPQLFGASHRDGTELGRHQQFLAWRAPGALQALADLDLLSSPVTTSAFIEITSRCNLRCVYCAVSQPDYVGQDLEADVFNDVIQTLQTRRLEFIQVNAHGETTLVPNWYNQTNALADAGIDLQIITNFARLLSRDELAAMARMRRIVVSIDTHRPEVLRKVRRHVSLGNILINMANTVAKAAEINQPRPEFIWNCVITDRVALDFVDYLRFGMAVGVRTFFVANLTKYDDIAGAENVNHVTTLPDAELKRFAQLLDEGREIVCAGGGHIDIAAGLADTVQQELRVRGL
jgi:hypothetical protein